MNKTPPPSSLLGAPAASRLYLGPNFSGRTAELLAMAQNFKERGFVIAPDITSAFSGFASTVKTELDYFSDSPTSTSRAHAFITSLGMEGIMNRNPLTLSGGEQAVAALAMAIGSGAEVVAADCCFEQLDPQLRSVVVECFESYSTAALVFADNRADEHPLPQSVQSVELPASQETAAATLDPTLAPDRVRCSNPIELRDIRACYKSNNRFALSVPLLTFQPGTIYQLVGPNGAGKTTLCRVLVGLLRTTDGTILVKGRRVTPWRHPGSVASLSFQNPDNQLFADTVETELLSRGLGSQELESTLKCFGVPASRCVHPGSLPFVLRKRLSLAATLSSPRGWYILDEPTIGQDSDSIASLSLILKSVAVSGCGVIVVTHSKRFAKMLGAHQVVLKGGVCGAA